MSRKSKMKRHQSMTDSGNTEMSDVGGSEMVETAREKLSNVAGTVNNHKLLIAGIAGACGAAIFLLGTDRGRRIRNEIQDRAVDLYDLVSEQASTGMSRVRDLVENLLSRVEAETGSTSGASRRVA